MEANLGRYIWAHTKRQQIWMLVIVALSMVPYYLSFNLPKQIVNGPIQGEGFSNEASTQLFMRIDLALPVLGNVLIYPGVSLDRAGMLFALSSVFLMLVVVNGLFKFYINTYKGRLGERLLRRIRFDLVDRILRFPPAPFKRIKGAEISTMVKDEVEPLGGFTGDAFVAPALLGGQAATAFIFIFIQSPALGIITAALVLMQVLIIPRMRRRLLVLGRERQLTARELAGRVSELVDGIHTIRTNDTSNYERADIAFRLGQIYKIRYDIYQWKFLAKFVNNLLASLTPFLFYTVGGWLTLQGRIDIGQLVAVIAAYKDLPGPLKELIDWDQTRQDVQIKYSQVVGQFSVEGMIAPEIQAMSDRSHETGLRSLAAVNLSVVDDSGALSLEGVNLQFKKGESVAVVGDLNSGSEALLETLARITWPEDGLVMADETDILTLPEALIGRSVSYVPTEPFFFFGSLRDNLLYGLKHAPALPLAYTDEQALHRRCELREAALAGNPGHDINSDWINYRAAGVSDPDDLPCAIIATLDAVLMKKDVFNLALRATVDQTRFSDLVTRIVDIRRTMRNNLESLGLKDLIIPFDPKAYNVEATVLENLMFGNVDKKVFPGNSIGDEAYVKTVLEQTGLSEILFSVGLGIAENVIELFSDLPRDITVSQQISFIAVDEIPSYAAMVQRVKGRPYAVVAEADRATMVRLSFSYVEPRYRFGLLSPALNDRVIAFREVFHGSLPEHLQGAIEQYDSARYMLTADLLDNVLFGKIGFQYGDRFDRICNAVAEILDSLGLYDRVLDVGLEFHVGAGGRRLTAAQRHKISLARAILRKSDFYLINRLQSPLDSRQHEQIVLQILRHLRDNGRDPGVIWVVHSATLAPLFDRIVVLDKGKVTEDGTYAALVGGSGVFSEMVAGRSTS